MKELEGRLQNGQECMLRSPFLFLRLFVIQGRFDQLEVPVTKFMPEELIDPPRGVIETVFVKVSSDIRHRTIQAVPDPPVTEGKGFPFRDLCDISLKVHERKAGRVPYLVDKVSISLDPLLGHLDVPPLRGKGGEGESYRVGPIFIYHFKRIYAVPLRLAHLLALLIAYQGMQVNIRKGDISHDIESHHHHAGHPEEDNIETGNKERGGIEGFQGRCLVGPPHRGEGPKGRAEPGIQDIFILPQRSSSAVRTHIGILGGDNRLAAPIAIPHRYPVPPPDLTGDTPVTDVVHPVEIGCLPHGGNNLGLSLHDGGDCVPGQRFDLDEPLFRDHRLYGSLAPITASYIVRIGLCLDQIPAGLEVLYDIFPTGVTVLALIGPAVFINNGVTIYDGDYFQVVALGHGKVIGVGRGGNLHRTGPEFPGDVVIRYDRYPFVHNGENHLFPDNVRIPLIVGIDGNGGISQHRLRTGGGHDDLSLPVGIGVSDMPEAGPLLFVFDLEIGYGRMAARAPVHDIIILIDEPVIVKPDKDLAHRP